MPNLSLNWMHLKTFRHLRPSGLESRLQSHVKVGLSTRVNRSGEIGTNHPESSDVLKIKELNRQHNIKIQRAKLVEQLSATADDEQIQEIEKGLDDLSAQDS